MAIMYLLKENFSCPKGQNINAQLNLVLTVLIQNVNFIGNTLKPDINSIENSADRDQNPVNRNFKFAQNEMGPGMVFP